MPCEDRFVALKGELSSVLDPFLVHICWLSDVWDQMRPGTYPLSFLTIFNTVFCNSRNWVLRSLKASWPFFFILEHQIPFPFSASPLYGASRTRKTEPAVHGQ